MQGNSYIYIIKIFIHSTKDELIDIWVSEFNRSQGRFSANVLILMKPTKVKGNNSNYCHHTENLPALH